MASNDITVALTGDAGDENFAGYDRYLYDRITSLVAQLPSPIRYVISQSLEAVSNSSLELPQIDRGSRLFENASRSPLERYTSYIYVGSEGVEDHVGRRIWQGPKPTEELRYLREAFERAEGPTRLDQLMNVDINTYLPDDLLVKVDRASMAHSLEVRSPFLDHEFIEYASSIPAKYKLRRGEKKWILKRAFEDILPESVLNRSKQGFSVPLDEWFRGDLQDFAAENLDRLGQRALYDRSELDAVLDAHITGKRDYGGDLWNLVMLEQWYERYL
jgi:asparagine synthase (glutamine-hydrolysing)